MFQPTRRRLHGRSSPTLRRRRVLQLTARLAGCASALPVLASSPALPRPKMLPPPDWRPPVISVPAQGQAIQLRAVTIDTEVFGSQAQSHVEIRLFNPNPRVLEGELQFPT